MQSSRTHKLGAIAVTVVALAGVGTAYAASKLHSGSHAANAASSSGKVAAGAQQTPPSTNRNGYRGGFGFGGRPDGGRGFGFGGPGGSFSAATAYLGISPTQLFADIQSGKTLAQIANSTSGKSASGLIDAMVAAQQSQLNAAVKSGRITQAMATQIASNLKSRVARIVNGGFGRFGGGGGGFGSPPTQTPSQNQPGSGTSPT